MLVDPAFRLPVLCLTALTMLGVLVLLGFVFRYRNEKVSVLSVLYNIEWSMFT